MAEESTHGEMGGRTMENTRMIKKMVMEYINGMMADNTKDIGKMANNMVLEDTY
jgi:hypothetical protein